MRLVILFFAGFGVQASAHAYLGPGLGIGTIAVALGFIGSILLAIFALLYYPIKRMIKKLRRKEEPKNAESQSNNGMKGPNEN